MNEKKEYVYHKGQWFHLEKPRGSLILKLFIIGVIVLTGIFFEWLYGYSSYEIEKIHHGCDRYRGIINYELSKYEKKKFDTDFICSLIFVESSFIETAKSTKGAIGLMQVTRHAWSDYNEMSGSSMRLSDIGKVENNITLGVWYLHRLFYLMKKKKIENLYGATLTAYWMGIGRFFSLNISESFYSRAVDHVYKNLFKKKINLTRGSHFLSTRKSDDLNFLFLFVDFWLRDNLSQKEIVYE